MARVIWATCVVVTGPATSASATTGIAARVPACPTAAIPAPRPVRTVRPTNPARSRSPRTPHVPALRSAVNTLPSAAASR